MASNESTAERDTATTGATTNETVNRAARAAHEAIDKVAAKAAPALDQFQSVASNAAQTVQDKAEVLGQLEDEWLEKTRAVVRENPVTAVLAAVVAGLVISRLL